MTLPYDNLVARGRDIAYLNSISLLLDWDERTGIPSEGHTHRANQQGFLARARHRMIADPLFAEWLAAIEGTELTRDPESVEAVNIREWKRLHERTAAIPESLAVELAQARAEGTAVWEQARPANDWDAFLPFLERNVKLKRQQVEALGYDAHPYDALLDGYEPGMTVAYLTPLFAGLKRELARLIDALRGSSRVAPASLSPVAYPRSEQEAFGREVAHSIGYRFEGGRLDDSAHPFTAGIGPGDVRITTRYDDYEFGQAFFSIVHEAGHALYHQGLPLEHWGSPFCSPASLGINESQSRLWENMVARSPAFWRYYFPRCRELFPSLQGANREDFVFSLNQVAPGLIRTDADEVTYNLHILVRFELEVLLMEGGLEVQDLPQAWREKMAEFLGIVPQDHKDGVMQDVHWSSAAIGYFPTYTLGNLCAAQFLDAANKQIGPVENIIERGAFPELLQWLRTNIHRQGCRFLPRDLVERVTGEALDPGYLIHYLSEKYLAMYRI
jgi:carboxypeptidase Taq